MLGLELSDAGFDYSVLSEFRSRLLAGKAEERLLDKLLEVFKAHKLIKERSRQRTDSTHIQAAVRRMNRLEKVGETLRFALNELARVAPEWLQGHVPADWYLRYGARIEEYRLPREEAEQQKLAIQIGKDGYQLLEWVYAEEPQEIRENKAVEILWRVWVQEYYQEDEHTSWRDPGNTPPSDLRIDSPYDPEARYSTKRDTKWVGYKVHFTETCDPQTPHLIVNVETTPAPTPDDHMAAVVHASLAKQDRLPAEHLVDKGYTDAQTLLDSQQDYQVRLVGPVANDPSWQARAGEGFDKSQFRVDWKRQVVTCPAGKQSISWHQNANPKNGMVWEAHFSRQDCTPCPFRSQCTHAKVEARVIGLQTQEKHEILQETRKKQETPEFREEYAARAGIESTHEQAIRRCGLRHARYIGLAKTHLQHVLTAVAVNLIRIDDWWNGVPLAPTRCSRFASLKASALAA